MLSYRSLILLFLLGSIRCLHLGLKRTWFYREGQCIGPNVLLKMHLVFLRRSDGCNQRWCTNGRLLKSGDNWYRQFHQCAFYNLSSQHLVFFNLFEFSRLLCCAVGVGIDSFGAFFSSKSFMRWLLRLCDWGDYPTSNGTLPTFRWAWCSMREACLCIKLYSANSALTSRNHSLLRRYDVQFVMLWLLKSCCAQQRHVQRGLSKVMGGISIYFGGP